MVNTESQLNNRLLIGIAVLQGLALLALYRTYEHGVWPSEDPMWSVSLWTMTLVFPVMLLLGLEQGFNVRVLKLAASFTLLTGLVGAYVGWQATPLEDIEPGIMFFAFGITITIATFKALIYVQQFSTGKALSYPVLFTYSWRNFLVMALALLFVAVTGLILLMWAGLFEVIGVKFFSYLFRQDWFLFPVLGFAFGLGIVVFRELIRIIDTITSLLQGLIRLLLPIVVFLAVLFLASLSIVGTEALWQTNIGSVLMLWLCAVLLFFVNAVYQDGRGDPAYSLGMHRFVYIGLIALPGLSILSLYGLVERIDQYGMTVARLHGLMVWLVLSMFAAGYVWGGVTRRDAWTEVLAKVNIYMGWFVLALMLVTNSPLLDFRKIALASQLARFESGEISIDELDVRYLRTNLARPGFLAYQELLARYEEDRPNLVASWQRYGRMQVSRQGVADNFRSNIRYQPTDMQLPVELKGYIDRRGAAFGGSTDSLIVALNLDGQGESEYVHFLFSGGLFSHALYYKKVENMNGVLSWQSRPMQLLNPARHAPVNAVQFDSLDIKLVEPRLKNVQIGDLMFRPDGISRGFFSPLGAFPLQKATPIGRFKGAPAAPSSEYKDR
ncbi:MAG: DUF4153 domain-containing protein [Pseudomonadales bacterium]